MKKWEKYEAPTKEETYNLIFGHHLEEPQKMVCLFRDSEGNWRTTSDLLGTYWTGLAGAEITERDAKILVEEMVYDHYADEMRYYQEICQEFEDS